MKNLLTGALIIAAVAASPAQAQSRMFYKLNTVCSIKGANPQKCVVEAIDEGDTTLYRHTMGKRVITVRVGGEPVRMTMLDNTSKTWVNLSSTAARFSTNTICFNGQDLCVVNANYLNSIREERPDLSASQDLVQARFDQSGRHIEPLRPFRFEQAYANGSNQSLSDKKPDAPQGMIYSVTKNTYTAFVNGKQYNCTQEDTPSTSERLGYGSYKMNYECEGIKIIVTRQGLSEAMREVDQCVTRGYEVTKDKFALVDKEGNKFYLHTPELKRCKTSPDFLYRIDPSGSKYTAIQTSTASSDEIELRFIFTSDSVLTEKRRPAL